MASIVLFRDGNYRGGHIDVDGSIANFKDLGFNDCVSSAKVGSGTWTLFEHANYQGRSVTVSGHGGPDGNGLYPHSTEMGGLNDTFSSIKLVSEVG